MNVDQTAGDVTFSESSLMGANVPGGGEGVAGEQTTPLVTGVQSVIGVVATADKTVIRGESVQRQSGKRLVSFLLDFLQDLCYFYFCIVFFLIEELLDV